MMELMRLPMPVASATFDRVDDVDLELLLENLLLDLARQVLPELRLG